MVEVMYRRALIKKYEAQMEEALANLTLYLSDRVVGIGEHSDIQVEQDMWLEKYSNAKDKLENLKSILKQNEFSY
jgi:hypothetical protein